MFFPSVGVRGTDLTHSWSKTVVGIPAFSLSTLMKCHYQPLIALEKQGRLLHCHCWHNQQDGRLPEWHQKSHVFTWEWRKKRSFHQRTVVVFREHFCFLSFLFVEANVTKNTPNRWHCVSQYLRLSNFILMIQKKLDWSTLKVTGLPSVFNAHVKLTWTCVNLCNVD